MKFKKQLTLEEAIAYLQSQINTHHNGSNQEFAQYHGIAASYIGCVLNGKAAPGRKITDALGLKKVISYEFAEGES